MIRQKKGWNQRLFLLCCAGIFIAALLGITAAGAMWEEKALQTDFSRKNMAPCIQYPFGTDWMGRDMFIRTITGLSLSIRLGLFTAVISAGIGAVIGVSAIMGKWVDGVMGCMIDLVMGIPHMLLLILISFAVGRGFWGVAVGISLTHWTSLARLLRAEALQLKESPYVAIARKLGKGWGYIAGKHMAPHLLPQLLVGTVLLFPHAILHEAGITFLGFGLSPEQPAIGVILSESMGHLMMGRWWLALFPGALLAAVVMMFHVIGNTVAGVLNPKQAHS